MWKQNKNSEMHLLDQQVKAGIEGDFARGWEIAEELRRTSPDCHRAGFNRAWYMMMRGDLLEGLKLLDNGRWVRVFGDPPLPTNKPIYRNEDLTGKYILICSEGGLGDEIINARFVTDFAERGAKVTITCDPSLTSVFSRIKGVSAVIGHRRTPEVYHDYWVPGMSAARVLEYTYDKLTGEPYLTPDPVYVQKWKNYFYANKIDAKIGLRFYGNPKFEHEQHRRFPPQLMINAIEDRSWVNLQKEETNLPIEGWEDTLAIISLLDLVITSCTSVAHASAAMGKQTWVVTPVLPYYIWALPGETSPWYKSVRLFRQEKFGQWENTFERIKAALVELRF
jgi:hypothetical protein